MKPNLERSVWRRIARATAALAIFAVFAPARTANAQQYKYEIRLDGGGWLPMGKIADDLKSTGTVGATGVWYYSHDWSAQFTALWTPSEDKNAAGGMHVNVYQYDVGLEWAKKTGDLQRWDVLPFLGFGLGSRVYSPKRPDDPEQDVFAGYVSGGFSFTSEHETWRLGLRDYVSAWHGITNTQSTTGNDVVLYAGIGLRF